MTRARLQLDSFILIEKELIVGCVLARDTNDVPLFSPGRLHNQWDLIRTNMNDFNPGNKKSTTRVKLSDARLLDYSTA